MTNFIDKSTQTANFSKNKESIIQLAKSKYYIEEDPKEVLRVCQIFVKMEDDLMVICDELKRLKEQILEKAFFPNPELKQSLVENLRKIDEMNEWHMTNCENSVLHACLERYRKAIKNDIYDDDDDEEQEEEEEYEDENVETRILLKKIRDLKLLDPLFEFSTMNNNWKLNRQEINIQLVESDFEKLRIKQSSTDILQKISTYIFGIYRIEFLEKIIENFSCKKEQRYLKECCYKETRTTASIDYTVRRLFCPACQNQKTFYANEFKYTKCRHFLCANCVSKMKDNSVCPEFGCSNVLYRNQVVDLNFA